MELTSIVESYFRGERQLGLSFVYLGLALLGVAYFSWRSLPGTFGTALAFTGLLVGLGLTGSGSWFERKTEAQVAQLTQALTTDRSGALKTELARMDKVNGNWAKARLLWLVMGLVGAVLLNFVRKDVASAVGLALVLLTAVLFVVDELGERRAERYTEGLRSFASPEP